MAVSCAKHSPKFREGGFMGKTNWKRVFLGGLVAGVVLLILTIAFMPLFMPYLHPVMESLGHPYPAEVSVGQMAFGIIFSLIMGIVTVWLYSAIRPRFGAGPKTAVIAGFAVWFLLVSTDVSYSLSVFDLFPFKVVLIRGFALLIPNILAAMAGAWVYKE